MSPTTSQTGWGLLGPGLSHLSSTRMLSGYGSRPRKTWAARPEEPASPEAASPAARRAGVTRSSSTGRINLHNKFLCKQMSDLFFLL